jgi:hypothetical protein
MDMATPPESSCKNSLLSVRLAHNTTPSIRIVQASNRGLEARRRNWSAWVTVEAPDGDDWGCARALGAESDTSQTNKGQACHEAILRSHLAMMLHWFMDERRRGGLRRLKGEL